MRTLPNAKLKMTLFKKGLTQRALAFGAEVDEGRLSRIIRGWETPTPEIMQSISEFLGVEQAEIF